MECSAVWMSFGTGTPHMFMVCLTTPAVSMWWNCAFGNSHTTSSVSSRVSASGTGGGAGGVGQSSYFLRSSASSLACCSRCLAVVVLSLAAWCAGAFVALTLTVELVLLARLPTAALIVAKAISLCCHPRVPGEPTSIYQEQQGDMTAFLS
jgi:hypothetical protein